MAEPSPAEPSAAELAAGDALFRRRWSFLRGVADLDGLPAADRPEIALAGRSNVGKSSLINALTFHGGLARTSNTPGRTQELNYFLARDADFYLVDMPGYGFAEAPKAKVAAWNALIRAYLRGRSTLRRVFVLIDARHGPKPIDDELMAMLDEAAVSFQVVLTKTDKVTAAELGMARDAVASCLARHPAAHPAAVATSASRGTGLAELRGAVAALLAPG